MKRVFIGYSRSIGLKCFEYAHKNMPTGFELCDNKDDCDIFISVMYDTLLEESFIKERKCYNFHPGVLPFYRGSGAFTWAIINNESTTGITLHEIDKNIDTGPIINVQQYSIYPNSTAYDLYLEGMDVIYEMFVTYLPNLLEESYIRHPNPCTASSLYTRKMLDDKKDITDLVRGFTFPEKEGLYYYTSDGRKIFLEPYRRY